MPGIIERGTVIAASEGSVDVRVAAGDACASCAACCHVDREGVTVVGARDGFGSKLGDEVEVEIPEGADTRAGIIVFILPAVGLLAGYAGGYLAALTLGVTPDVGGAVGAVAAVVAALLVLRARGRDALSGERYRPRVRAIIAPGLPPAPSSGGRLESHSDSPTDEDGR
jgi:sigma-E factor negative regulatory protein RseC